MSSVTPYIWLWHLFKSPKGCLWGAIKSHYISRTIAVPRHLGKAAHLSSVYFFLKRLPESSFMGLGEAAGCCKHPILLESERVNNAPCDYKHKMLHAGQRCVQAAEIFGTVATGWPVTLPREPRGGRRQWNREKRKQDESHWKEASDGLGLSTAAGNPRFSRTASPGQIWGAGALCRVSFILSKSWSHLSANRPAFKKQNHTVLPLPEPPTDTLPSLQWTVPWLPHRNYPLKDLKKHPALSVIHSSVWANSPDGQSSKSVSRIVGGAGDPHSSSFSNSHVISILSPYKLKRVWKPSCQRDQQTRNQKYQN